MEVQSQEISLRYHKLLSEIAGIAAIDRGDVNQTVQKSASHIVAILFYAFGLTILADGDENSSEIPPQKKGQL